MTDNEQDQSLRLIDGQAVRIDWGNGTYVGGVVVTRDDAVMVAFGQTNEFNLQIVEAGQATPVLIGATVTAIVPSEPTGFAAVAVDEMGHHWVHTGRGRWVSRDEEDGVDHAWDVVRAVAVIDWGHSE